MLIPIANQPLLVFKRGMSRLFILALVLALAVLVMAQSLAGPTAAPAPDIKLDLSSLPLSFIPNAGQIDPAVRFQTHDMGGTVFFTADEVVLVLPAAGPDTSSVLRLHFVGANPAPQVASAEQLPGVVNYFTGRDPAAWRTNVPTYAGVVYQQLYPGIDLRYDGTSGRLKGTYVVAPGADPGRIRWQHAGATQVRVDAATGNLVIGVAGAGQTESTLVEQAPVAWQNIDGRQVPVTVAYDLGSDGTIGFALGTYNPAYPLTIDPTLIYSTYLGGTGRDDGEGIAVDGAGNAYITGSTSSTNFPTKNALQGSKSGASDEDDVFVSKINVAGNSLVYSTFLGGAENDQGNDIAVDGAGNAYITGRTHSTDFPTKNPIQANCKLISGFLCLGDAFVAKLNANGNALEYSTYLGGDQIEQAEGIAVDTDGNAYVTGSTTSTNFPTQAPFQGSLGGGFDAYVAKLNAAGSALVYSTFMGGSANDFGAAIALDGTGRAYVTGETHSTNFPTQSPFQAAYAGNSDCFVARLNAAGSALEFSTYLGGSDKDYAYGIAANSAGQAFLAGHTESTNFPTTAGAFDTSCGTDGNCNNDTGYYSYGDAFVTKLNAAGSALEFSTFLGGSDLDKGHDLAVDGSGNVYVTGDTFSTDFPTLNAFQGASNGDADAYVVKLNAAGSALEYSSYLGGAKSDHGNNLALDGTGYVLVAGLTSSTDFPTVNPLQGSLRGVGDVFLAKIDGAGVTPPTPGPNLSGSRKQASRFKLGPGETLTFTIRLHNSGTEAATATVTDQIPSQMTYVAGSVTGGGSYDPGTRTITWNNVAVPLGGDVLLTFDVTATVDTPTLVVNTAVITPQGKPAIERQAAVLLLPVAVDDDTVPPVVNSVTIDDQDVLTNRSVTLHISASDDVGVEKMYIREWQLATTPFPHWEVVRSTGWVDFDANPAWTLGAQNGVHFVAVWVADAGLNVSQLDRRALDYASLVLPGATVAHHGLVPYLVHYQAGTNVTATLSPSAGDADLYVWYPGSFLAPDQKSTNPGTATDQVQFSAPRTGTYLFVVHGYTAATYNLAISPAGGPQAWSATGVQAAAASPTATSKAGELTTEPVLTWTGLDPLGVAVPPVGPVSIYLPLIYR